MRKIFTLLIVAILATATSWAAEKTKTYTFTDKSWSATDESGNPANWKGSKDGNQFNVSQSPIGVQVLATSGLTVTSPVAFSNVKKVTVNYSSTKKAVGSISVKVGDTDFGTKNVSKSQSKVDFVFTGSGSGNVIITNKCTTNSFALVSVKVVYDESSEPQKTVKSLAITGEPTNKEYYVGDAFSADGLKVNATYDDDTQEDVTAKATWAFAPATFTEAGAASVTATATYGGVSASTTCPVTVKTIANTKEGAYTVEQAIALIEAGKGLATPVYVKGVVSKIVTPYSTQYKNITFDVSDDGATTTPQFQFFRNQKDAENTYAEDPNIEVGATVIGYGILKKFNDTYEFDKDNYLVEYIAPVAKILQSIAISGTPQTEYTEGETFSAEGLVVTATYDDASTAVVTTDATWSFEPATLAVGTTSVTATATYNEKTASETYNVTVKEIPSYTYTWMVNGAEVKKSVLKEGTAVEVPANPENIDGKVFTGWVTTATVDANVAPTYATIDETAKANTTYYAVFATLKQGAGEKWVKKAASEITEEGVYALITKDGKAFSGTIIDASGSAVVKGNGESTTDAFIFDSNNEATSAPEGTCELTFVKSGEGFKMLNADKTQCLYSYKSEAGNLSWKATEKENSYWFFYDNNWTYKQSATTYTYLRVYTPAKTSSYKKSSFRTYPKNNSNEDMYFAQKVSGAGYADFTTIVKVAEVTTLANLAVNGAEGTAYQVNDEMVVAKKFQKAGKNYIVVKDAAQAVRNFSTPAADDKFFNINGNKQEEYAQNNWMLVSLPVELYNQVNETNTVTSITGTLTEKTNVAMEATKVVFEDVINDFAPNTYCPINILGESSVKGNNPAYTSSYYFATPKANEYANVVWAVYDDYVDAFFLPSHEDYASVNVQEFEAAFYIDYSLNSVDNPALADGSVYSFEALVKEEEGPSYIIGASTKFVVYPLNLDADKVATGVNDVNSAKEVKGVSYFNMMGVESAQPFDGVNIMVTTYTDGTQSAAKVLR